MLILFLFSLNISQAQLVDYEFQKLFDFYILDQHEECLEKSLKMIDKDKYHRAPEAYLFAARSHLALADIVSEHKKQVNHTKAALKMGGKYVKYKNKTDRIEEYDALYSEDQDHLKSKGLEMAFYFQQEMKSAKASYYTRKVLAVKEDDPSVKLLAGLAYLLNRNVRYGQPLVDEALDSMNASHMELGEENRIEGQLLLSFMKSYKKIEADLKNAPSLASLQERLMPVLEGQYASRIEELN